MQGDASPDERADAADPERDQTPDAPSDAPSDTSQEDSQESSLDDAQDDARRRASDTSVPAIVATVALVIFSIFIGVYGPRLGNRQQVPGGTTLVELASALSARHSAEAIGTIELLRDDPVNPDTLRREAGTLLGRSIELPRLQARSITWLRLTRVRVPGAAGVQMLLRVGPRFNAEYASVFILRDEDRFTVFDAYGRPRALPEGEMFSVGVSADAAGSVVHIFRAGNLVYGCESTDREVADELVAEMQSIAARLESASDAATNGDEPTP